MTLYRVYYKEENKGCTYCLYIEVSDKLGRKKTAEVRRIADEEHGVKSEWIVRIVKDC